MCEGAKLVHSVLPELSGSTDLTDQRNIFDKTFRLFLLNSSNSFTSILPKYLNLTSHFSMRFVYICREGDTYVTTEHQQQTTRVPTPWGPRWHALYVMPRAEKKVTEKLLQKGVESYIPLVESVRFWSDRKKKIKLPLISGIVFVRIDQDKLPLVLSTPGVVNIIRYMGKPAVIQDYEMENLRILVRESEGLSVSSAPDFQDGEPVRVVQGSFFGLIGLYVRSQGRYRVVVELKALNSYIEVNIPVSFLEKINQKVA
jgi:transcription antitermination factor NusG